MEAAVVSKKRAPVVLIVAIILLVLAACAVVGFTLLGNSGGDKLLTQTVSEARGEAKAARFDINTGTGNLNIDRLTSGEDLLASGTLEYMESQGRPVGTVDMNGNLYTYTLKAEGARKAGFQLPWAACNGETNWQIHVNPQLPSEVTAHSGGGNVKIDLAGTQLTQLAADTGGGNVEVVLPDQAAGLSASAKSGGGNVTVTVGSGMTGSNTITATSGAGNVTVSLPAGSAVRIHAKTGAGKVLIDAQFTKIDETTFQSPNYDSATNKIEITIESGAGDVKVVTTEA